ncbi:Disulfide-bond oxidoreductase YfcG [Pseudovibrio sp. Ad46]|uniref:glutathione S-transferase family protein n=1 Tax=Pseudovibrio sp. Ad46 TaxID=989432 RepID=UPI0007AE6E51|nr:glutathione S-transferase [Pseudovibrio sp. Ad46]KZK91590.1 Disulfide-bond oxidoreductase YfcG [Pseudovibrio sp. Ad46]
MAEYELQCFAQSGNAYKVALMLELSQASWTPTWVDFFNGATRDPEFRSEQNEMGEIPVLIHGETRLTQSAVILEYLSQQLGTFGWESEEERREILRWLFWDNHKLTSYVATLRYMRAMVKTGETDVTRFFEGRTIATLKVLDQRLANNDFLVGNRPTIADLSVCGYLFWPEEIGVDFGPYSNVNAWLERIKALPHWVAPYDLMPGHPLPTPA